jgi:hypothetical protein
MVPGGKPGCCLVRMTCTFARRVAPQGRRSTVGSCGPVRVLTLAVDDGSMEPSAYFLAVRAVVNREDPVGLLVIGAPANEYDPEVRDLTKWRQPATAGDVRAVFLRWFGASGVMPSGMAARIADGINQARAQHMSI